MRGRLSAVIVLVAGLTACKKSSGSGDTTPDSLTCADVEANVRGELASVTIGDEGLSEGEIDELTAMIGRSCVEDSWSSEAITCAASSKNDEMERCDSLMPPGVSAKLSAAYAEILGLGSDGDYDDEPPPEEDF